MAKLASLPVSVNLQGDGATMPSRMRRLVVVYSTIFVTILSCMASFHFHHTYISPLSLRDHAGIDTYDARAQPGVNVASEGHHIVVTGPRPTDKLDPGAHIHSMELRRRDEATFGESLANGRPMRCTLNNPDFAGGDPSKFMSEDDLGNNGWSLPETDNNKNFVSVNAIKDFLDSQGLSSNPSDYNRQRSTHSTGAFVENLFNAAQGTIISDGIMSAQEGASTRWNFFTGSPPAGLGLQTGDIESYNVANPDGVNEPALSAWSDISYLQWSAYTKDGGTNGLQRVIEFDIKKAETRSTIDTALQRQGLSIGGLGAGGVSFAGTSEEAAALLGTNNGKGSFYLLWQHVAALGRKSLKGVRVFSDSGKSYHMMFEFDALTPTEPGTDPDVPERPPCNPETSWEIVMWVKPENFDEVTRDLPKDDDTETYTPKGAGGWMWVGTVDECTLDKLWEMTGVLSLTQNLDVEVEGAESAGESSTTITRRDTSSAQPAQQPDQEASNGTTARRSIGRSLMKRAIAPSPATQGSAGQWKTQTNSPKHLRWLTQLSRLRGLRGMFRDFPEYIYNDGPTNPDPATVYVVDTGFHESHRDFANRVIGTLSTNAEGDQTGTLTPALGSHGTCMASLVAGSYSGVAKRANLVLAQLDASRQPTHRVARIEKMFSLIAQDIIGRNGQGKSVVTMSFGVGQMDAEISTRLYGKPDRTKDAFSFGISQIMSAKAEILCSAGNNRGEGNDAEDLANSSPRRLGGRDTQIMVVGNAQMDNTPYTTSNRRDTSNREILSLYNVGTELECALLPRNGDTVNDYWGLEGSGSSQATAITAGMVAHFLGLPNIRNAVTSPFQMKDLILTRAKTLKGSGVRDPNDANARRIPLAALGEVVTCDTATNDGFPAVDDGTFPVLVTNRALQETLVTDDGNVVFAPLPECYNVH